MIAERVSKAFDNAPAALPALIHLSQRLSAADLQRINKVMMVIEEAIPTIDSRLQLEYTISVCSALLVCKSQKLGVTLNFVT